MEKIKKNQVASLKISKDVIASIARVAALEVSGVAGLAEQPKNIKGMFSKRLGKPIEINLTDDLAEIDISLNLKYGAKITEVCPAVQSVIKENVQTMTGIIVSKVNVNIESVKLP